jgi:hypothetical protein
MSNHFRSEKPDYLESSEKWKRMKSEGERERGRGRERKENAVDK